LGRVRRLHGVPARHLSDRRGPGRDRRQGYYRVTASGLVISVDYTAWGWTHLLLGVVIVAGGVGVLAGNLIARVLGFALAGISAVLNLLFIEAYPLWSVIVVTVDVLVIYALTVHGREMGGPTR
jgi:hypothetical protein